MDKSKLLNLKGIIPDNVINQINPADYTDLGLAHFLSQCAHESANFSKTVENLNYSDTALLSVFKKYFPNAEKAKEYARKPEKIANLVYANRMGNRDETSGDGWKFRGRGYIQLTGHDNYAEFSKHKGVDFIANPDLVATLYPLESARFYFDKRSLWYICDEGSDMATVTKLTIKINGGTKGLESRVELFNKFWELLK